MPIEGPARRIIPVAPMIGVPMVLSFAAGLVLFNSLLKTLACTLAVTGLAIVFRLLMMRLKR